MSNNNNEIESDIKELAKEIAGYLREHNQAADTIEGITRWWILQQRLHEGQQRVLAAIKYLCAEGLISSRQLPDGKLLYTSSQLSSKDEYEP